MNLKKRLEHNLKLVLPSLIEQIKNGDLSKKDELAVLLLPYVKLLARKYHKVIQDELDSLAGMITARIIHKINNIDLSKSIVGYIARSTINFSIDQCRKYNKSIEKQSKACETLTYDEYYKNFQSNGLENLGSLRFFLEERLCPSDTEIVDLFFLQNKTLNEISVVTGQSEEVIQETLTLAKEYLCR